MLLSTVARCRRFPTVTSVLFRYHSPLNGPIRHFRSGGVLTQIDQVMRLPQNPVTELGLPVAATPDSVGNSHYWQQIPFWKNVSEADFLSYQWQVNRDFFMGDPYLTAPAFKQRSR